MNSRLRGRGENGGVLHLFHVELLPLIPCPYKVTLSGCAVLRRGYFSRKHAIAWIMQIYTMNHSHDLETQRVLSLDGYRVNAATEHGAPEDTCPATTQNS